jgi:hypothetical protein
MSADDTSYETAMNALGILTATFHDGHQFGPVTKDYLAAVATDGRQVLRLATGMTALTRLLIGMRAEETGVRPEETLEQLGRRIQELFSGSD